MGKSEDSIDPEEWRKSQATFHAGYEAGKESSERDQWNRASQKRDRQMDRAIGATVFWALPIFFFCKVYLESAFGWNLEIDALKMIMYSSLVILIFYLTLRAVIGKD